ncbi:MAG: DUF1572 family protein [Acidobacteriota bacterium]
MQIVTKALNAEARRSERRRDGYTLGASALNAVESEFTVDELSGLSGFKAEFARYKRIGQKALDQTPDEVLNRVFATDNNSMAMVVRHISGNLISRFTDFLTSDGEKTWRNRDSEFDEVTYSRDQVEKMWNDAWTLLENEVNSLGAPDLEKRVLIRGEELSVFDALARSLAHTSYHVGQIVTLARITTGDKWESLSVPKKSGANENK